MQKADTGSVVKKYLYLVSFSKITLTDSVTLFFKERGKT